MSLTIAEILRGTGVGAVQSAGQMQVIPLLGDDDYTFAPPELEVGTTTYGTVLLRNDSNRPTIVPPGAGWVVAQRAQDHAVGGGALLWPGESRSINTAMCIQQSQGGYIEKAKHALLILPAALRAKALSMRHLQSYNKLWAGIQELNASFGISQSGGHLEYFLQRFQKELDGFVAEFELVPRQVGAVILVGGKIAGIERAPSADFWKALWTPLVRICYGSLALKVAELRKTPPPTRVPLTLRHRSFAGLRDALAEATRKESQVIGDCLSLARGVSLEAAPQVDEERGAIVLRTFASTRLSGQVATVDKVVRYASLCAAA